jgi:hypothetical protein
MFVHKYIIIVVQKYEEILTFPHPLYPIPDHARYPFAFLLSILAAQPYKLVWDRYQSMNLSQWFFFLFVI